MGLGRKTKSSTKFRIRCNRIGQGLTQENCRASAYAAAYNTNHTHHLFEGCLQDTQCGPEDGPTRPTLSKASGGWGREELHTADAKHLNLYRRRCGDWLDASAPHHHHHRHQATATTSSPTVSQMLPRCTETNTTGRDPNPQQNLTTARSTKSPPPFDKISNPLRQFFELGKGRITKSSKVWA